jgi:hypothetical protein
MDVVALYPSIPIIEGLIAVNSYLNNHNIPDAAFLTDLISWVLNNNYIEFNQLYYKQIQGTAMGTPVAVAFATIFLAHLEDTHIFPNLTPDQQPLYIKRYIDDIFSIFPNRHAAALFQELFDRPYPTINTTNTISDTNGIFLDIEINKAKPLNAADTTTTLEFNLYQKATNKYLYLPTLSYHQPSTFTAFVTAELKRYRLNCTTNTNYNTAQQQFYSRLRERDYKAAYLQPLFASIPDRTTLILNIRDKRATATDLNNSTNQPLNYITQYCPEINSINLKQLVNPPDPTALEAYHTVFNNRGPQLCYRYHNNISKQIVTAKLPTLKPNNITNTTTKEVPPTTNPKD